MSKSVEAARAALEKLERDMAKMEKEIQELRQFIRDHQVGASK